MNEYRNCITGDIVSDLDFRKKIPNEAFPLNISDEDLLKYGYEKIIVTPKPVVTKNQIVTIDGTKKDENNKWVYNWKIINIPNEIILAKLKAKQNEVWKRIQAKRDETSKGGVLVKDHWYHTDSESYTKYLSLLMAGLDIPPNIMWKTMDGTKVLMTAELVKEIYKTAMAFDGLVFSVAETLKDQMLLSDDPETFDITVGWPTIYS